MTRKVRLAWLPWIKSDLVTVPYFLVTFMLTCRLSDAPGARVNGISRVWGVVQQQEVLIFSMTTGSHALVRDWFHMDRVTTFEDVCERAESLTMDQFAAFAQSYPSNDLTVVTIGAAPVGQ